MAVGEKYRCGQMGYCSHKVHAYTRKQWTSPCARACACVCLLVCVCLSPCLSVCITEFFFNFCMYVHVYLSVCLCLSFWLFSVSSQFVCPSLFLSLSFTFLSVSFCLSVCLSSIALRISLHSVRLLLLVVCLRYDIVSLADSVFVFFLLPLSLFVWIYKCFM